MKQLQFGRRTNRVGQPSLCVGFICHFLPDSHGMTNDSLSTKSNCNVCQQPHFLFLSLSLSLSLSFTHSISPTTFLMDPRASWAFIFRILSMMKKTFPFRLHWPVQFFSTPHKKCKDLKIAPLYCSDSGWIKFAIAKTHTHTHTHIFSFSVNGDSKHEGSDRLTHGQTYKRDSHEKKNHVCSSNCKGAKANFIRIFFCKDR